jgi:hypothetical protein
MEDLEILSIEDLGMKLELIFEWWEERIARFLTLNQCKKEVRAQRESFQVDLRATADEQVTGIGCQIDVGQGSHQPDVGAGVCLWNGEQIAGDRILVGASDGFREERREQFA